MKWDKLLNEERLKPSTRDKTGDIRNEFESDYGRIIFSPAVRRMHDKTQVFPLTSDDNIHSRLTHSLEVASVGESIALNLLGNKEFIKRTGYDDNNAIRTIPVIVKNACLIHDIGNPPFGHFGETVIQNYFANTSNPICSLVQPEEIGDFRNFDGNAQGFRVLTKLQALDNKFGLNLTFATLGAYVKYPNFRGIDKQNLTTKKRGVFYSEREYLEIIFSSLKLKNNGNFIRHPLSFVMEAADSICYLIMDIEDGFNKGWYSFEDIKGKFDDDPELKLTFDHIGNQTNLDSAQIVNLRLALIKRLVLLSVDNFVKNIDRIYSGEYNFELIEDDPSNLATRLKNFCKENIFFKKEILSLELTGHAVLTGLLDYYIKFCLGTDTGYRSRAVAMLSKSIIRAAEMETGKGNFDDLAPYFKLRVIVDFISGMTDQYALTHYQRLSGQKIS